MSMTPERESHYLRVEIERGMLPHYKEAAGGAGWPLVIEKVIDAYDALKADSTAQAAEIETLKQALSGRTVSCDHCNTTSAENERLKAEVERLTDELSNATSDLLSAGGEIQDLEFRLDAAVKEIESARQQ